MGMGDEIFKKFAIEIPLLFRAKDYPFITSKDALCCLKGLEGPKSCTNPSLVGYSTEFAALSL